ncbi:MAG: hypothetical protein K2N61_04780 [Lachnospiraceae bacterium]|nr:hypothetical protein [Lachnospiraceae bacterium]MDE7307969.1 hypothetical protein [Lachnospiraceae bacterium]
MGKLQFNDKKILKLTNVLKYKLLINAEDFNFDAEIQKMQSYIKIKGAVQVGPLIQHTRTFLDEEGELNMDIVMMLQCNHFLHSVESPYFMESVLRIPNCLYCRYTGPEDKLKFAYDKIYLEAFENDISLKQDNYTIFVDQNEEEGSIIADVFVPREEQ